MRNARNKPNHCKRCKHAEARRCLQARLEIFAQERGKPVDALPMQEACGCACHAKAQR